MKKAWMIIIIAFALVGLIVWGTYAIFDNLFPMADPIRYPSASNLPYKESISSISLAQNNGASVMVESDDIGTVLQNIANAQPTRIMSVNDYPAAKTYYTITVETPARKYWYFIYEEDSQVYIEVPYEGVYTTNHQFFDFVVAYFDN